MTGLRFDSYEWRGGGVVGREAMLRFGPESGPIVIAALPLFEEANRTRRFLVGILRALAAQGIGSVLPDFPGTGESPIATIDAGLADQRAAYFSLSQQLGADSYALSIRSGALFDTEARLAGRWQLAPQTGADLLRQLDRTRAAASTVQGEGEYAGNRVSGAMIAALQTAVPREDSRLRTVRLAKDPRAADVTYPGAPLWHRAEPGDDPVLAQRLAADIAHWMASCAG